MRKIALFSLLGIMSLVVVSAVSAQTSQAGIIFQAPPQVVVSAAAEGVITIQNNGTSVLAAGTLEVTLPTQLTLQSSPQIFTSNASNQYLWNIPSMAAGSQHEVRFVVKGASAGQAITTAQYTVSGTVLVKTSASTSVTGASAVKGETTPSQSILPVTGTDPLYLLLAGLAAISLLTAAQFAVKRVR